MKRKMSIWVYTIIASLILVIFATPRLNQYAQENLIYGDRPRLFGATYMTMTNDFYNVIDEELKNAIEASGGYLITRDPQLSAERQIQQIEDMIAEGIEVLFVNPVDSTKLVDVLQKAKENGVIVIAIDTTVYDEEEFVDYSIVSDNYLAGKLCAQKLIEEYDSAKIVLLEHGTVISAIDRIHGFLDEIQGMEQYEIVSELEVEGQMEKSMIAMEELIDSGLDFDVVMSLNDPSAIGCIAALREAGMEQDVTVFGVDGSPDGKKMIANGYLTSTVAQFPKVMAKKAVSAAFAILDGEVMDVGDVIQVALIDAENISDFQLEAWQ